MAASSSGPVEISEEDEERTARRSARGPIWRVGSPAPVGGDLVFQCFHKGMLQPPCRQCPLFTRTADPTEERQPASRAAARRPRPQDLRQIASFVTSRAAQRRVSTADVIGTTLARPRGRAREAEGGSATTTESRPCSTESPGRQPRLGGGRLPDGARAALAGRLVAFRQLAEYVVLADASRGPGHPGPLACRYPRS